MNTRLETHPYCTIFPPASADEQRRLKADIKRHGQRVPIVMFKEQILDGRSRYEACLALGLKPHYRPFDGTEEQALQYAVSMNLHRRHLSQSQKAAVCVAIERQLEGCGVPKESAHETALKVSGSAERTAKVFERIEQRSPKLAEKIANGKTTVNAVEAKWSTPTSLDRLLRYAKESRNAAHSMLAIVAEVVISQDDIAKISRHHRTASELVELIEEAVAKQ